MNFRDSIITQSAAAGRIYVHVANVCMLSELPNVPAPLLPDIAAPHLAL